MIACRLAQVDDVALERRSDVDASGGLDEVDDLGYLGDRGKVFEGRAAAVCLEDLELGGSARIAHRQAHHEAIELGLRQRIRPFVLERVLRRDDHERGSERVRGPIHGDLALLHAFEQGRLGLRGCPVDLVPEADVREHRPPLELEAVGGPAPDVHAGDVARQQVGSELNARPRAPQRTGERLGEHGLPHSRHVLEENVPFGDQGHQGQPDCITLALDGALDVADDPFERALETGEVPLRISAVQTPSPRGKRRGSLT
jgi:hypothetical protein